MALAGEKRRDRFFFSLRGFDRRESVVGVSPAIRSGREVAVNPGVRPST